MTTKNKFQFTSILEASLKDTTTDEMLINMLSKIDRSYAREIIKHIKLKNKQIVRAKLQASANFEASMNSDFIKNAIITEQMQGKIDNLITINGLEPEQAKAIVVKREYR